MSIDIEEATRMVAEAIGQRRRFGKHFTVSDMPPEFLDALVIVNDQPNEREATLAKQLTGALAVAADAQEKLTLANRQLGAAKSRETQLRQKLSGKVTENDTLHQQLTEVRDALAELQRECAARSGIVGSSDQ